MAAALFDYVPKSARRSGNQSAGDAAVQPYLVCCDAERCRVVLRCCSVYCHVGRLNRGALAEGMIPKPRDEDLGLVHHAHKTWRPR
jgi:hypothetical protein